MNAYSKDLRLKVLDAVGRGMPRGKVASLFGVSLSTIKRTSSSAARGATSPRGSPPDIISTREEERALWEPLEANDEATLKRHCELWEEKRGMRVSIATMSRAIRNKLGWTYKKRLRVLRPWCSRRLAPAI